MQPDKMGTEFMLAYQGFARMKELSAYDCNRKKREFETPKLIGVKFISDYLPKIEEGDKIVSENEAYGNVSVQHYKEMRRFFEFNQSQM